MVLIMQCVSELHKVVEVRYVYDMEAEHKQAGGIAVAVAIYSLDYRGRRAAARLCETLRRTANIL